MLHYKHPDQWLPANQLTISAFDLTVFRGFGVFDFLRTYNQKPFHLEPHLERLQKSAQTLGIELPLTLDDITQLVTTGIQKNTKESQEFNLRFILTGGMGADSLTPGKPQFLIIFEPALNYPDEYYTQGIKVITAHVDRVYPQAKSLTYTPAIINLQQARKQNALEVLFTDKDQNIYEGTTSNFFAVIDNQLYTPKDAILGGITRQIVFDIAKDLNLTVNQTPINLSQLPDFQEAFITASNKEVMPVVQINDERVGDGTVGPITTQIITEYKSATQSI